MESGTAVQLPEIMGELKAPSTYQEWLESLKWMESHYIHEEDIERIGEGNIPQRGLILENFQKRVVATVNTMLKRYIRNFNRTLNEALERNEFDTVQQWRRDDSLRRFFCFLHNLLVFRFTVSYSTAL